ncbi:hypothetical protein ABT275_28195 [Streptomyces sp. NPDC001185]|uniref:hypothetical protein n=1 Tax=Streptomyces sp. NPDC001185 TaxID=3154380 RepID=UPI00332CEA58
MKFPFPLGSLLYMAGGLSGLCVMVTGAGAGFPVDAWWGLGAGLVLEVGVFLVVKTTVLLCSLQTRETLRSFTRGDPEGEAAAHVKSESRLRVSEAGFCGAPGRPCTCTDDQRLQYPF